MLLLIASGLRPASARVQIEKKAKSPEVHANLLRVLQSNVLFNDIGPFLPLT
jgi:hypothetical protein